MIADSLRNEGEKHLLQWGVELDREAWRLLENYLNDVLEYNKKVNLTAARTPEELIRRHALDALACIEPLRKFYPEENPRILDLGSGAGFIGICLKIAWPKANVTLIESVYRKTCFLNWTSSRLAIAGLTVLRARARENKSRLDLLGAPDTNSELSFDVVTARALAKLPKAVRLAMPLCKPEGIGLIFQTETPDKEDVELRKALQATSSAIANYSNYRLPHEDRERTLVFLRRQ